MRIAIVPACALALLLCLVSNASADGKLTADPNAGSATQAVIDSSDKRLLQKITYDSGYKRLHDVAADLSQMTGVDILGGSSPKDWRVRDVPVVVYVKDMPLGKLLRAIADATHTRLSAEKIGKQDQLASYRIYRRLKEENEIDTLLETRHAAEIAKALWQWDAMAAYGKSKEIAGVEKRTWLVGKLIASLGPEARQKLLNGDRFTFAGKDPAVAALVDQIYHFTWEQMKGSSSREVKDPPAPSDEDSQSASLVLKLIDGGNARGPEIQTNLSPINIGGRDGGIYTGWAGTLDMANALRGKDIDLPPYPEDAKPAPKPAEDMDNPDVKLLKSNGDWSLPELTTKIQLKQPENPNDPTFCELVRSVAEASRMNIVAEDFCSHLTYGFQQLDGAMKKDTVEACLRKPPYGSAADRIWFYDGGSKLLIGWSDGWRNVHRNLLPADYVEGLVTKLKTTGVDFDDFIHLSSLTEASFDSWIGGSREISPLLDQARGGNSRSAFWLLYDALEPGDKAIAKSPNGLPLGKFDAAWIADFFHAQRMTESIYVVDASDDASKLKEREETARRERAFADPAIISTMMMRVVQSPANRRLARFKTSDGRHAMTSGPIPAGLKVSSYEMVIDYKMDGEDREMQVTGSSVGYPVRTPEREAEILKTEQSTRKSQQ